ncbi:hypothetical protein B0H14DRAFT_2927609 [Mycena olivaceomarginata]|nr:hypothetical protein B0H14DRAFT_2927609 [Mycena olivaceomarginata]
MPTTPESGLEGVIVVDRATTAPEDDPRRPTMSEQQLVPPKTPVTVKPTNFLFVEREHPFTAIGGTYVIDPRIKIPQSMLPPLAAGETEATRQNVFLHATNGSIDVNLFVLGDADTRRSLKMFLKCKHGGIIAKLHAASTARPPIYFIAKATSYMRLHLPRTFRGPVTVRNTSVQSSLRISEHLQAGMTPLSEANGTWRYFVGTLEGWTDEGEWAGDEVRLENSGGGNVTLQYDVEPEGAQYSSFAVCLHQEEPPLETRPDSPQRRSNWARLVRAVPGQFGWPLLWFSAKQRVLDAKIQET